MSLTSAEAAFLKRTQTHKRPVLMKPPSPELAKLVERGYIRFSPLRIGPLGTLTGDTCVDVTEAGAAVLGSLGPLHLALHRILVTLGAEPEDPEPRIDQTLASAETWIGKHLPSEQVGAIIELAYKALPVAGSGPYCRAEITAKATCGIAGHQSAVVAEIVDHGNPNPGIYFCKTTPLGLAEKITRCVRENLP